MLFKITKFTYWYLGIVEICWILLLFVPHLIELKFVMNLLFPKVEKCQKWPSSLVKSRYKYCWVCCANDVDNETRNVYIDLPCEL